MAEIVPQYIVENINYEKKHDTNEINYTATSL